MNIKGSMILNGNIAPSYPGPDRIIIICGAKNSPIKIIVKANGYNSSKLLYIKCWALLTLLFANILDILGIITAEKDVKKAKITLNNLVAEE